MQNTEAAVRSKFAFFKSEPPPPYFFCVRQFDTTCKTPAYIGLRSHCLIYAVCFLSLNGEKHVGPFQNSHPLALRECSYVGNARVHVVFLDKNNKYDSTAAAVKLMLVKHQLILISLCPCPLCCPLFLVDAQVCHRNTSKHFTH